MEDRRDDSRMVDALRSLLDVLSLAFVSRTELLASEHDVAPAACGAATNDTAAQAEALGQVLSGC